MGVQRLVAATTFPTNNYRSKNCGLSPSPHPASPPQLNENGCFTRRIVAAMFSTSETHVTSGNGKGIKRNQLEKLEAAKAA